MEKQYRRITGDDNISEGNVIDDYFQEYLKQNNINPINPSTYAERKNIEQDNDWINMLIISDVLKAIVIERRTQFNNIEFTFSSWK